MAERKLDENGVPQPFDEAEANTARAAYIAADAKGKLAVLAQYPFLAGITWKQYQPAADKPATT